MPVRNLLTGVSLGVLLATTTTAFAEDVPPSPIPEEAPPEEAPPEDSTGGPGGESGDGSGDGSGDENNGAVVIETAAPSAPETPWTPGLITSMTALSIGGISAALGIWVDRDKTRPVIFAVVMSILIIAAVTVGLTQSYLDAVSSIQQKEDLTRMLTMVNEIAIVTGDQSLADVVNSEMAQ